MNKITIYTKELNESGFELLKSVFTEPPLEIDSLDDLYGYLHKLSDTEITIINNESLNDESSYIVRVINDVYNDYHNFELNYEIEDNRTNKIILDTVKLDEGKHEYLKELFDLPDYYGNNLDALYDCMSELDDTEIIVINMDNMSDFCINVLSVLDDVADEYHNLKITYEDEENSY